MKPFLSVLLLVLASATSFASAQDEGKPVTAIYANKGFIKNQEYEYEACIAATLDTLPGYHLYTLNSTQDGTCSVHRTLDCSGTIVTHLDLTAHHARPVSDVPPEKDAQSFKCVAWST